MKEQLTDRQREVYDFLLAFWRKRGYPPSIREVAAHFNFRSTRAVVDHLAALERKGWIIRTRERSRAIEFPLARRASSERLADAVGLPVVGRIAAGEPILAVENIVEEVVLDRSWVRGRRPFLLKVSGDSMRDVAILEGDYVLVNGEDRADDGDIVAALIDEDATVKRLRMRKGGVELEPANPAYSAIQVRADQAFQVLGKVVGVFRKL